MVKGLYAIYDKKADMYSEPKQAPTDGVFTRMVADMIQEGNNQISNHPEDFAIFRLGEWNEITGSITGELRPVCECSILKGE